MDDFLPFFACSSGRLLREARGTLLLQALVVGMVSVFFRRRFARPSRSWFTWSSKESFEGVGIDEPFTTELEPFKFSLPSELGKVDTAKI
jgi:hypothetical protein